MADYIEREKVLQTINDWKRRERLRMADYITGWDEALEQIESNVADDIPAADVAPVVFCRDCVNHGCCSVEDIMSFARLSEDRCFCGVGKRIEINGGDKNG